MRGLRRQRAEQYFFCARYNYGLLAGMAIFPDNFYRFGHVVFRGCAIRQSHSCFSFNIEKIICQEE